MEQMEQTQVGSSLPLHVPNHSINPVTGFVESKGYATAFDSDRKLDFLARYKANGLGLYRTCKEMGLSYHTVHNAVKIDPAFKEAMDDCQREYIDELEVKSRNIALTRDSATLERIFQLRALRPEKYARDQQQVQGSQQIVMNVMGDVVVSAKKRDGVLETTAVKDDSERLDVATPEQLSLSPSESDSSTELRGSAEPAGPRE